jgi:secreted trypsin-like serine protease
LGHFCGGSIIDANYVISAAHCFFSVFFDTSIIYIGSHYLNDKIEQRTISEVIRHPSFILTDGNPNDIVLLKLNEAIDITAYPPICLPTSLTTQLESLGQNVIVAGWGLTEEGISSDVLLQTTLRIHDPSIPECQPFISDINKQLCVGVTGGGTGTCTVSIFWMYCYDFDHI